MPSVTCMAAAGGAPRGRYGRVSARPRAAGGGDQHDRRECRHRQQPVVELDRGDVGEQIADERVKLGIVGRNETAVHQREGVVDEPGAGAGDKPAGRDRQSDQEDDGVGRPPPARDVIFSLSSRRPWGEGRVRGADDRGCGAAHLTPGSGPGQALPPLRAGPLPLPREGRRGIFRRERGPGRVADQAERHPEDRGVDQQRQGEMGDEFGIG